MEEYPKLKNCDGYTDFSIKRIVVADFERDESSVEDLEWYKKKVLRHELVHAFIHESGLAENCSWARDEVLTDWVAMQFEKLLTTFKEVGAIESDKVTIGIDLGIDSPKQKEAVAVAMVNALKECNDKKYAELLAGGDG